MKKKNSDNNIRQSPQTRRFFVSCILRVCGFATKAHAIANLSLWPQSTDATVSSWFNARVIQLESYL